MYQNKHVKTLSLIINNVCGIVISTNVDTMIKYFNIVINFHSIDKLVLLKKLQV